MLMNYRTVIDVNGQALLGVMPDETKPGFMYTIGNAESGLPELLLIGSFDPSIIAMALNMLGEKMREEKKPFEEGLLDFGWSFPFKIRKCGPSAKSDYTLQATFFYEHSDYEVLQVMICDKAGHFPGDAGVEPAFDVPQP